MNLVSWDVLHWIPYALVRIAISFIAGILSAIYFDQYLTVYQAFTFLILLVGAYFLSCWMLKRHFFSHNKVIGIIGFITIFLLGYFNSICSDERLSPDHVVHAKEEIQYYLAKVEKPGEERKKTVRYEVEVMRYRSHGQWNKASGRVYLYLDKEQGLSYGDRLLIKGQPDEITPPKNPGEFDYKRFLSFKNIYHQHFVKKMDFLVLRNDPSNLLICYAFKVRKWASKVLAKNITSERELAIAQALILGVKDGLDNDIQNAYAASGAMHVLAVSGLHVGIVYGLLLLLFGKLQYGKEGKWILAGVSLMVLWTYALVTGFSPSVLRAVTMFSFVALARASNRNTNIYNTLAASAFFLLLYDPYLIMSVGFQLSFLAVFGIVYLQPKIYNLIIPNTMLMDKIWSITTVALAAQLATFPLGLFYFNQFPTFFFLSNLVVIPGAFFILFLGLVVLATSFTSALAAVIGKLLESCIYIMNEMVFGLENLPYAQLTHIHISVGETWLIFGIISMFFLFLRFKKLSYAWLAVILAVSVSCYRLSDQLAGSNKITIYKISNHTAIDFIADGNSFLYTDPTLIQDAGKTDYHILPNHLASNVQSSVVIGLTTEEAFIQTFKGLRIACWRQKRILILDGYIDPSLSLMQPLIVDYVLLCRKFDKDLTWVMKNFKFKILILDGSLTWYKANRLKNNLELLKVPYYSVYHNGAYEIKI